MQLDFTGRQMEITPALRKYTEKHMRKLARVLRDRFDGHVILTAEKHRRIAEITLKFRDHVLVGVQETAEVLSSVSCTPTRTWSRNFKVISRPRPGGRAGDCGGPLLD